VRQAVNDGSAEWLRSMHPHRLRFEALSDRSPLASALADMAASVRADRRPVGDDNPLRRIETIAASQIAFGLKFWGEMRDTLSEQVFLATYGSPLLQALVGVKGDGRHEQRRLLRDVTRDANARAVETAIERDMEHGGLVDAVVRAAIYVGMAGGGGGADERVFAALKNIGATLPKHLRIGLEPFKAAMRKQYLTLRLDERRAIATLPKLIPDAAAERLRGLEILRAVMESRERSDAERQRFAEIGRLFEPAGGRIVRHSPAA
jgi:hypothetical protein